MNWLRRRSGRARWRILAAVLGIAAIAGVGVLMAGRSGVAPPGDRPPDFSVETAQGPYMLAGNRGKTLVYFFSFPG